MEEIFFLASVPVIEYIRHGEGGQRGKSQGHAFNCIQKVERLATKWGEVTNFQSPHPVMYFPK